MSRVSRVPSLQLPVLLDPSDLHYLAISSDLDLEDPQPFNILLAQERLVGLSVVHIDHCVDGGTRLHLQR